MTDMVMDSSRGGSRIGLAALHTIRNAPMLLLHSALCLHSAGRWIASAPRAVLFTHHLTDTVLFHLGHPQSPSCQVGMPASNLKSSDYGRILSLVLAFPIPATSPKSQPLRFLGLGEAIYLSWRRRRASICPTGRAGRALNRLLAF